MNSSENKENNLDSISLGNVENNNQNNNSINLEQAVESLGEPETLDVETQVSQPTPEFNGGPFAAMPNIEAMAPVAPLPTEPVSPPVQPTVAPPVTPEVNSVDNNQNQTSVVNNNQSPMPTIPTDIDLTMSSMGEIPPVPPLDYVVPTVENNPIPGNNGLGTIPPVADPLAPTAEQANDSKKVLGKKGLPKIVFVIIILVSIAVVAGVVYYLLNVSNEKETPAVSVVPKEVHIEIGTKLEDISRDINNWATFEKIDSKSCSLNIDNITDTSVYDQSYEFIVTCNGVDYTGRAIIVDTVAPIVKTKNLNVNVNATVEAKDFIDGECQDSTSCMYEFKDKEKVNQYLATPGTYIVEISVRDAGGNLTEVGSTLTVSSVEYYLSCELNNENGKQVDKLPMSQGNFVQGGTRSYTFTFATADEYNQVKNTNPTSSMMTYNNVTGQPTFDDASLTLVITQNISYEELNTSFGDTLPMTYSELKDFYSNKNYVCNMVFE